jgi:hypothetical protein
MRVRVKADAKILAVTAFGGFQYIRSEWRDVPTGSEAEAKDHPYLEIEPKPVAPKPVAPKPVAPKPVAPKAGKKPEKVEPTEEAEPAPETE